jgi:hypothetical protein
MPEEANPQQPEEEKKQVQPTSQPQQFAQPLSRNQLEALRNKLQKKFH